MSSDTVIRCSGLGKAYRLYKQPSDRLKEFAFRKSYGDEFWALQDLDLELKRGDTIGIIGRNGSGKSTLLQIICGTLTPSRGDITVTGRVAALLELGAGFNPEFTGRENVVFSAAILGLTTAQIEARMPAIEAFAGIGHFMDLPVRQYSSGMYARLAFSVCAHVDADILVIDEILAVGDAGFQQKCMRYLRGFRERGTLLFVSHDEASVLSLCERALWLERGVTRAFGPSKDICREYLTATAEAAAEGGHFIRKESATVFAQTRAARDAARPPAPQPLDIFDFDPNMPETTNGGAAITEAAFYLPNGEPPTWIEGGEEIELRISCRTERAMPQPVVGFVLRNRLGIILFSDNTYLTYRDAPAAVEAGERFTVTFRFELPFLPSGDYAVEALLFDVKPGSTTLLARSLDQCFLHVSSSHISAGSLANVADRLTRFSLMPAAAS